MSSHEGVSCDSCQKSNFQGKRFKCLICFDYDLCEECHELQATTGRHLSTHPMQCLLTQSDAAMYFAGEHFDRKQAYSYTCPLCGQKGFSEICLIQHVQTNHLNDNTEVICPVCASVPGVEPNGQMVEFLMGHLSIAAAHQHSAASTTATDDHEVRIRPRMRVISGARNTRRSQLFASGMGASQVTATNDRDTQSIGSVTHFLNQLSAENRNSRNADFGGSGSAGLSGFTGHQSRPQTSGMSSRPIASSSASDRIMVREWRVKSSNIDSQKAMLKNENPVKGPAPSAKKQSPYLLKNLPPVCPETSDEVSIFEMDRSVFVQQLLLATLSDSVPVIDEKFLRNAIKSDEKPAKKIEPVKQSTESINKPIQGDSDEESADELSAKDYSDDETETGGNNCDENEPFNGAHEPATKSCDAKPHSSNAPQRNKSGNKSLSFLRLNSAPPPPTSRSSLQQKPLPPPQRQTSGTGQQLAQSSSTSSAVARANKVRSVNMNSGPSMSSLASSMRSNLSPINPPGAINVVSPTGRRRTIAAGGGTSNGHSQRSQLPESPSD